MRFSKIYYNEAYIHGDRPREVLKQPTIISMPDDIVGKRLVTIVNNDKLYFTFVFDPNAKEPLGIIEGDADNPYRKLNINAPTAKVLFDKHYTPKSGDTATSMEYSGEVRIHPPFKGYAEYPQDRDAYFFTDFNTPDSEYQSGSTIAEPFELLSDEPSENS